MGQGNSKGTVKKSAEGEMVMTVTSGLDLPTEPLPRVKPTAACIIEHAEGRLVDEGAKSQHDDSEMMLQHCHKHGFIAAVTTAFSLHLPLVLRPQHFWLMITQAVAIHVDLNAELVRKQWVEHDGQKELVVVRNNFVMGEPNDWACVVTGKEDSFSAQINKNTLPGVAEALSPNFSDTTDIEMVASKIVVMDICKNFFSYKVVTKCGFPEISLEGTVEDWQMLRASTEDLLARCEPTFAAKWSKALLPLLDKFSAARQGTEIDASFWNSMVKLGGGRGSGAKTWFNGWINIFFPYIDRKANTFCVPYSSAMANAKDGPDRAEFGIGMSRAPVVWEYLGTEHKLDFNAGFIGATQDQGTLQIRPQVGWYLTRTKKGEKEMEDPLE